MADAHAKDGSVHITISGDPDELTPDEARQLADDLTAAAGEAERQQRANWALCDVEHDWSQWFNGHNPFRNHYRRCQRPNCVDGYEQYPGWMPFAGRPHVGMFGPRQCYGPGCDHCEAEDFGTVMRTFLRGAAVAADAVLAEPGGAR